MSGDPLLLQDIGTAFRLFQYTSTFSSVYSGVHQPNHL